MGVESQLHAFLALTLHGDGWLAGHTGHFIPEESSPDTGWVSSRPCPNAVSAAMMKPVHYMRFGFLAAMK